MWMLTGQVYATHRRVDWLGALSLGWVQQQGADNF